MKTNQKIFKNNILVMLFVAFLTIFAGPAAADCGVEPNPDVCLPDGEMVWGPISAIQVYGAGFAGGSGMSAANGGLTGVVKDGVFTPGAGEVVKNDSTAETTNSANMNIWTDTTLTATANPDCTDCKDNWMSMGIDGNAQANSNSANITQVIGGGASSGSNAAANTGLTGIVWGQGTNIPHN